MESGVSPGFTELDEVQDEELRNRAWRDFIASTRSAGDRTCWSCSRPACARRISSRRSRSSAATRTSSSRPGTASAPTRSRAWKALEKFWKKLQKQLPADARTRTTTCPIQKAAREFSGTDASGARRSWIGRPVIAELLETWDCKSKIVQKWWRGTSAEKKRLKAEIEHAARRVPRGDRDALSVAVAAVCLSPVGHAADARARLRRRERHRRNSLNYGDLLNLTAKVLRENAQVRRALQQKYRHLFVDEFQDTDPVQAEIVFLLAADERAHPRLRLRRATLPVERFRVASELQPEPRTCGLANRSAPSWRALRRRRPEAVHLSLPPRRHRDLQHSSASASATRPSDASSR